MTNEVWGMFKEIFERIFQQAEKLPQDSAQEPSSANKLDLLKEQWELLNQKWRHLYRESVFETRIDEKFRLEHLMKELLAERDEIEQALYAIDPSNAEARRREFQEKKTLLEQEMKVLEQEMESRLQAERREKTLQNKVSELLTAKAEGWEEGREEGFKKGELIGEIRMLQRISKRPISSKEELAAKSISELTPILQEMEAALN